MTRPPATDKILSEAAANADPFLTVEARRDPTIGFSIRGYCEERSDVAVACTLRVQLKVSWCDGHRYFAPLRGA